MTQLGAILLSVLMVGHSLFAKSSPQMLQEFLRAQDPEAGVSAQIINGAPLRYNWDNGGDAEGVNARDVLPGGQIDVLILTEALPIEEHVEWNDSEDYALRYHRLATGANPDARVYLQQTWPKHPGEDGWRDGIERDLPLWQGIVNHVNENRSPGTEPMRLIPAGQAMARLKGDINSGAVPGLDSITALFEDDIHPGDLGHYFVSLVQFAIVTGQTPEGLPHRLRGRHGKAYDTPDAELAGHLQRIAWAAARAAGTMRDTGNTTGEAGEAHMREAAAGGADASAGGGSAARDTGAQIGMNLSGVNDWSVQQPFIDVMKTARPWIVHRPDQWGGAGHEDLVEGGYLDEHGWPVRLPREIGKLGTLILTDLPEDAQTTAGAYRLRFDGDGIVEVSGRARNVRYASGEVRFDFTPGPGPVELRIQRSDPGGTGDHVRNISVVKEEHIDAHERGEIFNPDWLARIGDFPALRFMDWMETNESTLDEWDDRPRVQDYTYALRGVPVDVMLDLTDEVGADPWFTLPHLADDDYVRRFAETVRGGLLPGRRVYAEFSNELWNWSFDQTDWAAESARDRWGDEDAFAQYHGMRAAQVARIWTDVFEGGAEDEQAKLVNVIGTQTGWLGLEEQILEAPHWQAEPDHDGMPPWIHFDAYAVTGYFGGVLGSEDRAPMVRGWIVESLAEAEAEADRAGLSGTARDDFIAAHRYDLATRRTAEELRDGTHSGDDSDTLADLLGRVLPYHAEVAEAHGLELVAYEGGTHVVGRGDRVDDAALTDFFIHFNFTPQMGVLYDRLLAGWQDLEAGVFMAYSDVYAPTKWGSWGALRHLDDDNPRWQALKDAQCGAGCE